MRNSYGTPKRSSAVNSVDLDSTETRVQPSVVFQSPDVLAIGLATAMQ